MTDSMSIQKPNTKMLLAKIDSLSLEVKTEIANRKAKSETWWSRHNRWKAKRGMK